MKRDILLAGVGGQGTISIAAGMAQAALREEYSIKQAETHGMSQRGGAVVSHLRYSDEPIYSDLIEHGQADLIVAIEPMEALRYIDYLSPTGTVITNVTPVVNIADYPDLEKILQKLREIPRHTMLNADHLARAAATAKAANMVLLGAASPMLGLKTDWDALLEQAWKSKGEKVVKANQLAFAYGRDCGLFYRQCVEKGMDPHHALVIASHVYPGADIDTHVQAWLDELATDKGIDLVEMLKQRRGVTTNLPAELEKELEPAR